MPQANEQECLQVIYRYMPVPPGTKCSNHPEVLAVKRVIDNDDYISDMCDECYNNHLEQDI